MDLEQIRCNRISRLASRVLIENSVEHSLPIVKRIVHDKLVPSGKYSERNIARNRMIKTAKQNSHNPAEVAMELATEITMSLLQEVPEYQKFNYVANIHQIIQNLFDRLYSNIQKGERRGATRTRNK
jgi:hypothetical protein